MEEFKMPRLERNQVEAFQRAFECFRQGFIELSKKLNQVFQRLNIDENYLHNVHMAKYSKKKRTRKKYLKKLIK